MSYKAVLFDLDGTLLDTLEDLADAMNATLEKMGYPHHRVEEYKFFVGDGVVNLVRRTLPRDELTEENIKKALKLNREEYRQRWHNKTRLYDGVPKMLDFLEKQNIPKVVLSNKPHEFTRKTVEHFLGKWNFQVIQGVDENTPKKPETKGALKIAKKLGIKPEEFLYIGDTNTDMQTAVAAGMYPVGALWGFRTGDELRRNGAQKIIEKPSEITEFF